MERWTKMKEEEVVPDCRKCIHAFEPDRVAVVFCNAGGEWRGLVGVLGYIMYSEMEEVHPKNEFCKGQFEEGENNLLPCASLEDLIKRKGN